MADNFVNSKIRQDDGTRNRAYDTRRDNDTFKTPSITIYDIDYAVLYQLKNKMKLTVNENGTEIPVPVMFSNGETWAQVQRHGYLRDKMRKVMTPIIMLRRTSVADDDRVPKLDIRDNTPGNSHIYFTNIQKENAYDWVNKTTDLNRDDRTYTYYASVIPDHVRVGYDLIIWAEHTMQLNYIVQQLNTQNRLPWGDAMQFVTSLTEFSFETMNAAGEDRIVKATTTLEVAGILQAEYELNQSTITKAQTIKRVEFRNEVEQYELYPDYLPISIRFGQSRIEATDFQRNRP
jgi:hypothetical protein